MPNISVADLQKKLKKTATKNAPLPAKTGILADIEQGPKLKSSDKMMEHPYSILGIPGQAGRQLSKEGLTAWIKYHSKDPLLTHANVAKLRAAQSGRVEAPTLMTGLAAQLAGKFKNAQPEADEEEWDGIFTAPTVSLSKSDAEKRAKNTIRENIAKNKLEASVPVAARGKEKELEAKREAAVKREMEYALFMASQVQPSKRQKLAAVVAEKGRKIVREKRNNDAAINLGNVAAMIQEDFKKQGVASKVGHAISKMKKGIGKTVNHPLDESTSATIGGDVEDGGGPSAIDVPSHPVGAEASMSTYAQQHNLTEAINAPLPDDEMQHGDAASVPLPMDEVDAAAVELPFEFPDVLKPLQESQLLPTNNELGAPITSDLVNTSATLPTPEPSLHDIQAQKDEMLQQYSDHTSHELIYLLNKNRVDPLIIKEVRQLLRKTLADEQNGGKQLEDLNNPGELNPLIDPRVGLQSFQQAQSRPTTRADLVRQQNVFATGFRQRNDVPLTSTTADPTIIDERSLGPLIRNIMAAERYTQSYGPSNDSLLHQQVSKQEAEAARSRQFQTNSKQFINEEMIDRSVYSESQRNTLEEIKTNSYRASEQGNIFNNKLHAINSRTVVDNLNSGPIAVKMDDDFSFCREMFRRS